MAPPRTTLILYIGSPKTGSTALQDFLWKNEDALAGAGIVQPHRDVAPGRGQDGFRKSLIRNPDQEAKGWRSYYQDFFSSLPGTAIGFVGTEKLWTVNPLRIIELYPELSQIDVLVLAVLRRQKEMLPAHYKQYLKSGGAGGFAEFVENRRTHYDYTNLVGKWSAQFRVRTILYAEARSMGITQRIVSEVMKDRPAPTRTAVETIVGRYHENGTRRSNRSISDAQALAIRGVNASVASEKDKLALRNAILRSHAEFDRVKLERQLVSADEIESIIEPFETSDRKLLQLV